MGRRSRKRAELRRGSAGDGGGASNSNNNSSAADAAAAAAAAAAAEAEAAARRAQRKAWNVQTLVVFTVPIICAVGAYMNALGGDFVMDDNAAVVSNRDVLQLSPLLSVFSNDYWGTPLSSPESHKSFRPLTVLTFRLNHALTGLDPAPFHVTNVLLHALSTCCFTAMLSSVLDVTARSDPGRSRWYLFGPRKMAICFIASLLFAVHPVHTEAVTGIVVSFRGQG